MFDAGAATRGTLIERYSNAAGSLLVDAMIFGIGYIFAWMFAAISLIATTNSRKIGWFLSKELYFSPMAVVVSITLVYGAVVAFLVHLAITYFAPGTIVKWIFGYGAGLYIAIPNYGLINDAQVPTHLRSRHLATDTVPAIAYVACSILLATGLVKITL